MKQKRLTKEEWEEVKRLILLKTYTYRKLSQMYGISQNSIYRMARVNGWLKERDSIKWKMRRVLGI